MPKAFLVKKCKKWPIFESKITAKRLKTIHRTHNNRPEPLFVESVHTKSECAAPSELTGDERLMFFSDKPLLQLHHSTAAIRSCLDNFKNQPKLRKEEGKKTRKIETKKTRSYPQNVNRPLIVPNEKFEFPKPSGPLPQTQYICQLCKEIYPDPFALAQHRCSGIKHTEYRCPECDKVFSCPANLASHRRWHRPRSPSGAKKTTASPDGTEDEKKKTVSSPTKSEPFDKSASPVNVSPSREYVCELCDKTFRRKTYLQKHMNSHNDDRPYPCQYCGKVFRSLTNRAKHVLNHAVGSKTFSCDICGTSFPNRGSLDRHSRIHNSEVYTCRKCSSIFYSAPGLARHTAKCRGTENETTPVPVRQG